MPINGSAVDGASTCSSGERNLSLVILLAVLMALGIAVLWLRSSLGVVVADSQSPPRSFEDADPPVRRGLLSDRVDTLLARAPGIGAQLTSGNGTVIERYSINPVRGSQVMGEQVTIHFKRRVDLPEGAYRSVPRLTEATANDPSRFDEDGRYRTYPVRPGQLKNVAEIGVEVDVERNRIHSVDRHGM